MVRARSQRGGFALIAVILVLAALLLLCTPFLLTARNADQASQQLFGRAETEVALENALTHSRALLEASHFSADSTPYFDSLGEVRVDNRFPEDFLNARDTKGLMWDARAHDVAGRIDLNSAPPQLLAAMMGSVTRLVKPLEPDDDEIPVASARGLDPDGFLWIGGELIHYGKVEGNKLLDLERGLGVKLDLDGNALPGPRPPSSHGVGAIVVDQRAFAPVEWRLFEGDVRDLDTYERLLEAEEYVLDEEGLGAARLAALRRLGTVHGGLAAGPRWQRAARMTSGGTREESGHIRVDSARWFNPGATVQITDGRSTELAVVRAVNGSGTVLLDRGLKFDYQPYRAEVRVLARRPVNINTAPAEVLAVLFENLKLLGRNQRVTGGEARALASLVVESRPFEGLEDFMRRVVLPAAGIETLPEGAPVVPDALAAGGGGLIDSWDAVAVYRNALNANDFGLEYSTMPFSFSSRDVYDLDLRAAVNAASGVERASRVRERTELIVPQRELFFAWARQEDYDEALRNDREAPYWMTGPNSTSRFDRYGSTPPTRMWAHLGTYEGQLYLPGVVGPPPSDPQNAPTPEHVFADRNPDEKGWVQLMPTRVDDSADPELNQRVLHFDHETRDPEGRYVPDQNVVYAATDPKLQWDSGTGMLRGLGFSLWIKPRSHADAVLMDVAASSSQADRVSLSFEGGDLVLRALDGGGDHVDTANFTEAAEVRYALASGNGPGLPIDVWSHVEVDVRGTRPSQMFMLVNGLSHGVRTLGLTRLTGQIDESSTTIPVESTEGFPDRGVVRIGNELIEYTKSANALQAIHQTSGPDAGFGGRNARVRWTGGDSSLPENLGVTALNHPEGEAVELYGFAQTLAADVTSGQGTLQGDLGSFRAAIVASLEGGPAMGNAINVNGILAPFPIGNGIDPDLTAPTGLVLTSAEDPDGGGDVSQVMAAFNPNGGYALLAQAASGETVSGNPIGGWEVVRYSGWSGTTLQIASWGDAVPELTGLQGADPDAGGGRRAFVVQWQALFNGQPIQQIQAARLFVVPISIATSGGGQTFVSGSAGQPQYAEISETASGENTEWVAYNTYVAAGSQLVRDDPLAFQEVITALVTTVDPDDPTTGGGGGGGGGGGSAMLAASAATPATSSATSATPQSTSAGLSWSPVLGTAEDTSFPLSRAVREALQHRGVMGTFPHQHSAGVPVRPVFRASEHGVNGGRPGKWDSLFLVGASFTHLGWPVTIARGHKPAPIQTVHTWQQVQGQVLSESSGQSYDIAAAGTEQNVWYFTLTAASPAPVVAGSVGPTGQASIFDTRAIARLLRFPSGERARNVGNVQVGGPLVGAGSIPSAVIDEVCFRATDFATQVPSIDSETTQAAQLELFQDFYDGDAQASVLPTSVRIPLGYMNSTKQFLDDLDSDGGLLRIGNEVLAYQALDNATGGVTIAQNGRGLLGTEVGSYSPGTPVTFLDGFRVAILSASVSATANSLPVTSTADFPSEGTLLIGQELVHYTRLRSGAFEMPAGSADAGEMDGNGPGLFRGRYGTIPAGHTAGEPVILFPERYWDRWTERADAPELSYFNFQLSQPAAFWREFYYQDEEPGLAGVQLGVLMRTDPEVPWDADPDTTEGLALFYRGETGGGALPISAQSDRVEWRVFVDYGPGAFDILSGAAHGWRATPRLRALAASYVAPSMTLRSVDK